MEKLKIKQILKTTLMGALLAIGILVILFAAFSLLVLYCNISSNLISQITTILGALSLFVSSFITSRIINKNGLLIGFIFGIVTSIIIFLISFFSTGLIFSVSEITKMIVITLASCLGGIFGVNSKQE